MSQKTVTAHVYGKEYTLACDAGQEQHLHTLIHDMNSRITSLEKSRRQTARTIDAPLFGSDGSR